MKKTPWIIAAATACVIGVGGGGTAYAMSNEVTVDAYGEQSSVRTFSPTVAEVLADQGIEVKDTDLVVPGLDEQVTDGTEIQIIERTPVTVTVDGEPQELLTTGSTVADALDDLRAGRTVSVPSLRYKALVAGMHVVPPGVLRRASRLARRR